MASASKRNQKDRSARGKKNETVGGHATRNALLGTAAVAGIAGIVYASKRRHGSDDTEAIVIEQETIRTD